MPHDQGHPFEFMSKAGNVPFDGLLMYLSCMCVYNLAVGNDFNMTMLFASFKHNFMWFWQPSYLDL